MNQRPVGLSAFDADYLNQFTQLGATLRARKTEELETQFQLFKSLLFNFIDTNTKSFQNDPHLRCKVVQICELLDIDILQVLHRDRDHDQFYYELSCKIIEFNNEESNVKYGGLISIEELLGSINGKLENRTLITLDDISKAIEILKPLNPEIDVIRMNDQQYIKTFKQSALSTDNLLILQITNEIGSVSVRMIRDNLGWSVLKVKEVLRDLVNLGYLWIDKGEENGKGEEIYWDPGWISEMF